VTTPVDVVSDGLVQPDGGALRSSIAVMSTVQAFVLEAVSTAEQNTSSYVY
jgi:hypothetical protein